MDVLHLLGAVFLRDAEVVDPVRFQAGIECHLLGDSVECLAGVSIFGREMLSCVADKDIGQVDIIYDGPSAVSEYNQQAGPQLTGMLACKVVLMSVPIHLCLGNRLGVQEVPRVLRIAPTSSRNDVVMLLCMSAAYWERHYEELYWRNQQDLEGHQSNEFRSVWLILPFVQYLFQRPG